MNHYITLCGQLALEYFMDLS